MARGVERKRLLTAEPNCVYCGGKRPATEIDHIPPKLMFPKGHRPKGLETPSCRLCNRGARDSESLVSLFANMKFGEMTAVEVDHFDRVAAHVRSNTPRLIEALSPKAGQRILERKLQEELGEEVGILDVRDPQVLDLILTFGAKCALSLHWHERHELLRSGGKVVVLPFTNEQALNDQIPRQLFELLPEPSFLEQGRKTSVGRFAYASRSTVDGDATAHWALFGEVLLFQLFAGTDIGAGSIPPKNIFEPGLFG